MILKAAIANVGDPRLVIPGYGPWSLFGCVIGWDNWLPPLPTVGSVVFWVLCWRWGSFVVSVFGGSRLGRCQSTSRHGTCRCYAQSARWCTGTQVRAVLLPVSNCLVQLSSRHSLPMSKYISAMEQPVAVTAWPNQLRSWCTVHSSYRWRNCPL